MRCIASVVAVMIATSGCGDNSAVCGPGTNDVDGVCTAVPTGGDCQDGTVLIGDACVDPGRGLHIDVEELPEPNGLGVTFGVETSDTDAGEIALQPEGVPTVIHGHITPFEDADGDGQLDPDYDTYLVTVTAPTLLEVSVDGVGGIDGAFLAVGEALGLSRWERFGIPIVGDTSKRVVFLPGPDTYAFVVADARSMTIGRDPPMHGQPAAAGDATTEYYMSITVMPLPDPTPIAIADHAGTASGALGPDDIAFFSAPMGLGFNRIAMTTGTGLANPAVVVLNNHGFRGQTTNDPGSGASAEILVAGFRDGDSTVIVADHSYDLASAPAHFDLAITIGDAQPLSRTGAGVDEPILTTSAADGFEKSNVYFFDVSNPDEIDGLQLAWSEPVDGVLIDQDRFLASLFTFDPTTLTAAGHTFTSYTGALRFFAPGRYYLAVYPPGGTVGGTLTATSTIGPLSTLTVTESMPITDAVPNPFGVRLFDYDAAAIWESLDITGTGTGDRSASFMARDFAYGSLVPLTIDGGAATVPPDPPVIVSHTFAGAPSAIGHITATDVSTSYLVAVTTQTGAGSLTLDFTPRAFFDFGTAVAGDIKTHDDQITAAVPERLYLIKTDPGNTVTVSTPAAGVAIDFLDVDENTKLTGTASLLHGVERFGLIAFRVRATGSPAPTINFTTTAHVDLGFYTAHVGATAFADICTPTTSLVLLPDSDDGLSAPLAAPAGFTYYGAAVTQLIVSSNGWLGFDTTATSAFPEPVPLPDGIGQVAIAPMWQDLTGVVACAKATGTQLIVQWTGEDFLGEVGQFQAILDAADDSIEFVYGPTSFTGSDGVIGVQNQLDEQSFQLGAFIPTVTPNSAIRFTHP